MNAGVSSLRLKTSGSQGYTLIELLAVLIIIAVGAALVMPAFSRPANTLKAEAGKIASTLRYLNDHAASTKRQTSVIFDLKSKQILWEKGDEKEKLEVSSMLGVELPSKGLVKEGQLIIYFNPSGVAEPVTVHLRRGDSTLEVTYNPISRRAKIHDATEG
ncbi:Tfp pilus assembly protein FimT/FimU [Nitrospirota bacterium]